MKVGTKSILFGAHCFLVHPWFVAAAWWKLNGFPWNPRLWIAFLVHDLGYIGKPNMDGPEGETHVELGARIMHWLFDGDVIVCGQVLRRDTTWYEFCLYHSRFYAKRDGRKPSLLCMADKLALALTPAWLYLPMVRATGEIDEYMALAKVRNLVVADVESKYAYLNLTVRSQELWYAAVQEYVYRWVMEHKDGREDKWTPSPKGSVDEIYTPTK